MCTQRCFEGDPLRKCCGLRGIDRVIWLKHLLSFEGRVSRTAFWAYQLGVTTVQMIASSFAIEMSADLPLPAIILIALSACAVFVIWLRAAIALCIKRAHDIGSSGDILWGLIVPLRNFRIFWQLCFGQGTPGPNAFGDDPRRY